MSEQVTDRSAKLRAFFARYVTARGGAEGDENLERAFAAVPREPFAGPPPWYVAGPLTLYPALANYLRTPDGDPAFLYQDVLIALDPTRYINIGEPGLHAFCLAALALRRGETVMHVGAGSGYYSAILAELVGSGGKVDAFEIDAVLAERARRNLTPWPQIDLHHRSGADVGLVGVDAIYVNAACVRPSDLWLKALAPGGRLLLPLQPPKGLGGMLLAKRPSDPTLPWPARFITRAVFVACQGLQDPDLGENLARSFAGAPSWQDVRSLHFGTEPDRSCWFESENWWLSTKSSNEMPAC